MTTPPPISASLDPDAPPGWNYNPSGWSDRLPIAAVAAVGFCISMYLAFYQWRIIGHVAEPFFVDHTGRWANGSERILNSAIGRMLPVPDSFLGAVGYLCEVGADLLGPRDRWRSMPWVVVGFGAIAISMAAFSTLLAILQPVAFGAYCSLCLCSAGISMGLVGGVMGEFLATLQHLRREQRRGQSLWRALRGSPAARPVAGA